MTICRMTANWSESSIRTQRQNRCRISPIPERAVYLLGAEDHGLSRKALDKCHHFIMIPGSQLDQSLNVSVAGSIIMYDRVAA